MILNKIFEILSDEVFCKKVETVAKVVGCTVVIINSILAIAEGLEKAANSLHSFISNNVDEKNGVKNEDEDIEDREENS